MNIDSPSPTLDEHVISESRTKKPRDLGTPTPMEDVLHTASAEEITTIDHRSRITPNSEISPNSILPPPKHNGASAGGASDTPRCNKRQQPKDDSDADPDYQPSDLSASSSDEYDPSEDAEIIRNSKEYGVGVPSQCSDDELDDSDGAQIQKSHVGSAQISLSTRPKKTPTIFWDDNVNLDDLVLENNQQKEQNVGNIDVGMITPDGAPGSEDVIILSGENDAVPSSPVALMNMFPDLLPFDLCDLPPELQEKLRIVLYILLQGSLISRREGLQEGIEKEHKWMRDFGLKDNLHPGVRPEISLFPWQVLGVRFLHYCRQHYGFALLADEMGVGKAITFSYKADCRRFRH